MEHSKVNNIKYENMETQPYLKSQLFTSRETKLLTPLRSRTNENFKKIFNDLYGGQTLGPLNCWRMLRNKEEITITALLHENINYDDPLVKQKQLTVLFIQLLEIKESILRKENTLAG